ncbi:MAG: HDOD domain-containing protein, partial [Verrucomicrobia bacterium]|nr:HDOD domain-containing protein [Verrucomicrobiota bacterium]
ELWTMSVAGAIAAEVLASRIGQARDTAYTFGLLHCVGMVAINEWSLRHSPGLKLAMAQFPREATEAERAVFGFIQAEAGGALLEHWQLPTEIVTPVRWQYAPQATATHRHSALILHLAKWVRDKVCDRGPPPSDRARLDALRLTPAMLEDVTDLVTGRLREIDTLLQLPELPADLHRCAVR